MGAIEKLWYAYIQTEEYQLDTEYNYQIPNDVVKELERLVGKNNYLKAEEMAMELACDAEKCGFIQGFKMAMELRDDCKRKIA